MVRLIFFLTHYNYIYGYVTLQIGSVYTLIKLYPLCYINVRFKCAIAFARQNAINLSNARENSMNDMRYVCTYIFTKMNSETDCRSILISWIFEYWISNTNQNLTSHLLKKFKKIVTASLKLICVAILSLYSYDNLDLG